MVIDRRDLLRYLASGLLCAPFSALVGSMGNTRLYISACADVSGKYRICGFSSRGAMAFNLALPGRGHSFAVHPEGQVAVHFARRPQRFAHVIDLVHGVVIREFNAPFDRHFYGHGVFSQDGHFLYASENHFKRECGVIGVYDAMEGYRRSGELDSHGIGPHEIQLLSDGNTLVVANGGILTSPELPRVKLNIPTMAPSLCYIDRHEGTLLQKHRLAPDLHQLSIRHIAVGKDDAVAVAMQYEGPASDVVPLVAVCRTQHLRGSPLRLFKAPADVLRSMKQYCGSICFDSSSHVVAVSAPRGNQVGFWRADTGAYLSSMMVSDGCGVSAGSRPGEFLVSSGRGGIVVADAWQGKARQLEPAFLGAFRWDNHMATADLE